MVSGYIVDMLEKPFDSIIQLSWKSNGRDVVIT
jgi:hypothetical protein